MHTKLTLRLDEELIQLAAEVIVTRDAAGFKKAELPIVAPEEFAEVLKQREAAQGKSS